MPDLAAPTDERLSRAPSAVVRVAAAGCALAAIAGVATGSPGVALGIAGLTVAAVSEIRLRRARRVNAFEHSTAVMTQRIIDTSSDGMVVVDAAGRIVQANPAAHELFAYDAGELVGMQIEDLVPFDQRDDHVEYRHGLDVSDGVHPMAKRRVVEGLRGDGGTIELAVSLSPLRDQHDRRVVAATVMDMRRESALLRALQRRDHDRDFILTALAHELRTPVTVLHGLLQLKAKNGPLDPHSTFEIDDTLHRQSARLVRLIDDLTDVSALVMTDDATPRATSVHALLSDAVSRVGERYDVSGVTVVCDPGLIAELDAHLVVLCVSHLVANAVLHGAPPVEVAARPDGDALTVTVTDAGTGLPPGVDPFAPMSWGRKDRANPGLGVGLTVVARRVGAIGGLVSATTRPDIDGTQIGLVLPTSSVELVDTDGARTHVPESQQRADHAVG